MKAKESGVIKRRGGAKGKRIVTGPALYGGRQRTLAKQLGQGMSGTGQKTEKGEEDILSEGRRTTRRKLIPHYGARSALLQIMPRRAPEMDLRSPGTLHNSSKIYFEC